MKLLQLAAPILATALSTAAFAAPAISTFEVAEDHTRFAFAPAPVFDDGMPAHGNPFVTQGYIYPAGTLSEGVSGTLEDGSPAFPDKVLGTWTCDGWFVGDGAHAETGAWLISRQVYDFGDGGLFISQGPELVDQGVAVARAITGATGNFMDHDGVLHQTLIGFNEHMGAQATMEIAVIAGTAADSKDY
ncbi:MAG: hypothetical protein GKR99_12690 [Rhodobacteraceae bacterium]|nr:hypothetical protein [Paracoccaceae bacterium]